MQITIDIPDFFEGNAEDGTRSTSLREMVANAAVERLVTDARREAWGKTIRDRVRAIRDDEIREAVRPSIEEALTKAIQPTDVYGTPKGEPVTLREHIVQTASDWLTKKSSERYGEKAMSPAERLIKEEVTRVFDREVKAALDDAKAQVMAAVQQEGARVLAETIARMAGSR